MISPATKYPNLYIGTSAYTCARYPAALVGYLRGHGRRKVLFGSNSNAARVFGLHAPAAEAAAGGKA